MNTQPAHALAHQTKALRTLMASVLLVLGIAAISSQSGCYERVVGARGLGADQYRVSEPYQENSKLDDWVFGEQKRDPHTPR